MNKAEQKRFDKLMEAARAAAFEAAEAMDRADAEEWTRLQDRAEALRNRANEIAAKRTLTKAKRNKAQPSGATGPSRTKR